MRSNAVVMFASGLIATGLAVGCANHSGTQTRERQEQGPATQSTALAGTSDAVVFIGLIAWAERAPGEYRAILADADCDLDDQGHPESPSPPNKDFCATNPGMYRHRPFLLFHNADFVTSSPPGLQKQGIFVNVTNTPCSSPPPPGGCAALSVELEGIPLKERSLEFFLSGTLVVDLNDLISSDDIPMPNWKLALDSKIWSATLGDNTDYVQAFVTVKSGDLEAADKPPLNCDDYEVPNKTYGLEADDPDWGCDKSVPKFYAEEVYLTHPGGMAGNISFNLSGTPYEVQRKDSSLPIKIYVMNVHPDAWKAPAFRTCTPHHKAFLWFYGMASAPDPASTNEHFFTCDSDLIGGGAADRHCPSPVFAH